MTINILLLVLGLGLLIAGAEGLVRGSSSVARRFGISSLAIGLTVVAFGTSMPELIVNIFSALKGTADLAIGNVIGSNISNILLILGVGAMIFPLAVKKSTVWKEIPLALLAMALVLVMGNDAFFDGSAFNVMSRTDGILMISMFIIFMYYTWSIAKSDEPAGPEEAVKTYRGPKSIFFILAGMGGLYLGGQLLVDNAVAIARLAGLSESLIGLTIVAVGTSLPEMATSVVAALHKQADLAVGNIVGSNIFNIFWILGLTSAILSLPFNAAVNIDVLVGIGATFMLFIALFIGRRHTLERWQGAVFLVMYVSYIMYVVVRG